MFMYFNVVLKCELKKKHINQAKRAVNFIFCNKNDERFMP